ncbi:hypothetical protein HOY80DRAFT_953979 [Tuber brumale]|nr:hypothetical protein HOY80DRAFT_953979 [Tuber brumale]
MLLRYLFGRQLLCRRCLSFIKSPTHQQRLRFPLPRKQFSTALPRLSLPQEPPELQDNNQQTPLRPGTKEGQTTIKSSSPSAALSNASEPPLNLSHIPKNTKLRNEDIIPLNGQIRYVDANLSHHGLVKFAHVIDSFDRRKYALICVNPSVVSRDEPPTCLLTPIAHLLEKERREAEAAAEALLQRQKKPAIPTRVLEFTWAISANDLAHKMKKMGEFLRKGNRVEVIIGTRKRAPKVSADRAKELVAKVRETGTEFGNEWKGVNGALGTQFTMFFEGKAPVKPEEEEGEKVEQKKRKKKKKKFMTLEELEAEAAEAEAEKENNRGE